MWQRACHNAYVVHAFEAGDRPRPFALNFCRGSAPWQRLVQSGFYEVALTLLFPGTVVPCDLTEPSRIKNHRPLADLNAPSASHSPASGPLLGPSGSRPAGKTGWIGRK